MWYPFAIAFARACGVEEPSRVRRVVGRLGDSLDVLLHRPPALRIVSSLGLFVPLRRLTRFLSRVDRRLAFCMDEEFSERWERYWMDFHS